jgi:hypothetical protein
MSTSTAKDLLAQADRLMRQRAPEELPVLTDLVIEEPPPARPERAYVPPSWLPGPPEALPHGAAHEAPVASTSSVAFAPAVSSPPVASFAGEDRSADAAQFHPHPPAAQVAAFAATDALGSLPRMPYDAHPTTGTGAGPTTVTATHNLREQFNAQLLAKLEELQHSVYSQVMQQLELYAAGSLKSHLRDTLLPALTAMANDIAEQVAEDTSTQVREVVSKAVDSEIARLRIQLAKRRP